MIDRRPVRDYYHRIIGYIDTDTVTGDQVGRDFYQWIVGYYKKSRNQTLDRYQRVVYQGNMLSALIQEEDDWLKKNPGKRRR